ncbi:hypothetical protein LK03_11400 [Pseudomonas cremoricolorata]|uniref:Iron-containing redox enzyme family protein n=2 Tax=Pseudomonas cremoricolorata TaxID=157783 RepID=A0A089WTK1_9PSED|nr:hypothetical protein LK03_11400 [Pseudomonas cremoricolorata]
MSWQLPTFNTVPTQQVLNDFYLREIAEPWDFKRAPRNDEYITIHRLEHQWNQYEEGRADCANLPSTAAEFLIWYQTLHQEHRREVAPFFEYLAERSSLAELNFYIAMEEQVDGRFDDVIALAQLGMSGDMKMALAENFWDEMGLGQLNEMHTLLFKDSAQRLQAFSALPETVVEAPFEALKNGNILLMYALRRQYHPRLLGALTILEHTAPYRFSRTVKAMRRLGVPEQAIYYHHMHVKIDANHGKQLLNRVIVPLIEASPAALEEICRGCLIRYNIAADYYRSIAQRLNFPASLAQ